MSKVNCISTCFTHITLYTPAAKYDKSLISSVNVIPKATMLIYTYTEIYAASKYNKIDAHFILKL